ncbi:hypothetical protein BV898_13839 [Hypsibius exemplaris]|uniref:Uncharacterized protein n=1 Tax=Hypsibius exemplaris TaxID=2072580 RepID=A0A1W0W9I7_HYPEX|nr:hypothetical protein BV898_13839 [Hypsibius exemplaris]
MNQNLGKRPCWSRPMNSATGSTRRPEEQKTVCLTNGQAVTSTWMQLEQQIQANPSVAIRCKGSCPCAALTCPTMRGPQGGRDFGGMMRQRMNNFQGQQTNNQDF